MQPPIPVRRGLTTPADCEHFPSREAMPREAETLLDRYAFQYGETYDSYLATEDDRQYFWSPGRTGVIGFVRWRRVLNVVGGLLAPAEHQQALLRAFIEFAELNGLTINFFNLGRIQRKLFSAHGFTVNKCTEELIVRLDRVNWQGKAYEWLRRQENFCVRQGLRVEEIDPASNADDYRNRIVPQLEEVNREHLAGTLHGRELVFFEGRFDPWSLRHRRLFVTWQGEQIIAFIVCNPALAGDMWAIEIYRRRADSPRGVMPFSMLQVMRQLKDEGVTYASLSSVPFLRCGPLVKNDDHRFEGVCRFFWHGMNWLFDVRGIYHFKSRFRPDYRDMYVATYPHMSYASMFSMLVSWELWRVSPLRLARHLIEFWRSRHQRQGLADPEPRAEHKIRDVRRRTRVEPWLTALEPEFEPAPARVRVDPASAVAAAQSLEAQSYH